jgi:CrcB protein
MSRYMWVLAGGGVGAVLRYAMGLWIPGQPVPWDILVINLSGSFAMGILMALAVDFQWLSQGTRLFWGVGVLGGYTTFSSFVVGVYRLLASGSFVWAYAYGVGTLLCGLLAAWAGVVTMRWLVGWREGASASAQEEEPGT